jgi:hypothetical protein
LAGQIGDFTIQPASFVYFDPIAAEYRTISSQPPMVRSFPPTPTRRLCHSDSNRGAGGGADATTPVPANSEVNPAFCGFTGHGTKFDSARAGGAGNWAVWGVAPGRRTGRRGVWWWQQRKVLAKASQAKQELKRPRQTST